jgi:hypothetical protein
MARNDRQRRNRRLGRAVVGLAGVPSRPDVDDVLMIDELTALPALFSSRQTPHATRDMQNVVRRCPLITASQSSSLMLANILSRKMPALLTTTLQSPKASIAKSHTACAPAILDTSAARRDGHAAGMVDLVGDRLRHVGRCRCHRGPEPVVAHHDLRAFLREQQRVLADRCHAPRR